MCSYNKTN